MDDSVKVGKAGSQSLQQTFLGAALPPISHKLVKKIESGNFVKFGDLLAGNLSLSDDDSRQKSKHHRVSGITEWLQGFAVYVAVLSRKQPHCIPDLMGYQLIILEAYSEFRNECWLGYDRHFQKWEASHQETHWAAIEPTLWSLAFQGQARSNRCKHCFSLSHNSADCDLSPDPQPRQRCRRDGPPFDTNFKDISLTFNYFFVLSHHNYVMCTVFVTVKKNKKKTRPIIKIYPQTNMLPVE